MKSLDLKIDIASFLKHLSVEKRMAKNTILGYRRDLGSLERFISKQKANTIESATTTDIQDFISSDFKKGLSARTIQRKNSSIRAFFYFLKERKAIKNNPQLLTIEVPRIDAHPFGRSLKSRIKRVYDIFHKNNRPVLGICYGSQLLWSF